MVDEFNNGDKVLAFHGPVMYTAKIINVRGDGQSREYRLHYAGWSKTWDEWVGPERLKVHSDENIALQQRLKEDHELELKKIREEKETAAAELKNAQEDKGQPAAKKRKLDEAEEENLRAIKIDVPKELKEQLITEWENITTKDMLVPLPRNPCVSAILVQYAATKGKNKTAEKLKQDLKEGLELYFDRALGSSLLYAQEREQYERIMGNGDKKPCEVYGAEHLLRLFVKLPEILACAPKISVDELTVIRDHLTDMCKYLKSNASSIFIADFITREEDAGGQ